MDVYEIVKKLVGDINPAGASHIDEQRFENLKIMCDLVNKLVSDIDKVSYDNSNRHEFSMKQMGQYAEKFLTETLGISNEQQ